MGERKKDGNGVHERHLFRKDCKDCLGWFRLDNSVDLYAGALGWWVWDHLCWRVLVSAVDGLSNDGPDHSS